MIQFECNFVFDMLIVNDAYSGDELIRNLSSAAEVHLVTVTSAEPETDSDWFSVNDSDSDRSFAEPVSPVERRRQLSVCTSDTGYWDTQARTTRVRQPEKVRERRILTFFLCFELTRLLLISIYNRRTGWWSKYTHSSFLLKETFQIYSTCNVKQH